MMWSNKYVALCLCVVLLVLNSCSKDEDDYYSITGTWAYVDNPIDDGWSGSAHWLFFENPPYNVQYYYHEYYKVFLSNGKMIDYTVYLDEAMKWINYYYSEKRYEIVDYVIYFPDEGTSYEIKDYLNNYHKVKDIKWDEMPTIEDYSISNIEKILPNEW